MNERLWDFQLQEPPTCLFLPFVPGGRREIGSRLRSVPQQSALVRPGPNPPSGLHGPGLKRAGDLASNGTRPRKMTTTGP